MEFYSSQINSLVDADAGIQADALDDLLRVQPLHLRIGIQLIEVADPQRQIGICKQLYGFRFGKAHKQGRDLLFDGPFQKEGSEGAGGVNQAGLVI